MPYSFPRKVETLRRPPLRSLVADTTFSYFHSSYDKHSSPLTVYTANHFQVMHDPANGLILFLPCLPHSQPSTAQISLSSVVEPKAA